MSETESHDLDRLARVASHFEGADELPWMLAAGAISQVYKHMSATALAVLSDFDLTMPRFEVLALLDQNGGNMSISELKRATLIHPPMMTYTMDWLGKRGFAERVHDRVDRRSIILHITDHGRETVAEVHQALTDVHYGLSWADREEAQSATDAMIALLAERPST